MYLIPALVDSFNGLCRTATLEADETVGSQVQLSARLHDVINALGHGQIPQEWPTLLGMLWISVVTVDAAREAYHKLRSIQGKGEGVNVAEAVEAGAEVNWRPLWDAVTSQTSSNMVQSMATGLLASISGRVISKRLKSK